MPARFPDTTFEQQEAEPHIEYDTSLTDQFVEKTGEEYPWAIATDYVLKSRRYVYDMEAEIENINFVAEHTSLPLPKIVASWEQGTRFLAIEERLEGESLDKALPNLARGDVKRIGEQVGEYLRQLKNNTSPLMEMLDGRPVVDRRLFKPLPDSYWRGYSGCATDAELRLNLSLAIDDNVDLNTMHRFMAKMPSALPFTFSHSDVHEENVMVKDGNFVGLLNWGLAGFYPSWWEFVNSCELLSDYFPAELGDENALEWFTIYYAIRERPMEPKTIAMLKEYLNRGPNVTGLAKTKSPAEI
ncbi:kinase-like protein [Annulohypoxylon truncatum]|uniref:kinase-like protein n=1 Tax=Annulohypoxylon truncatum TaxID=327061 RepID=UPI002007297D|nr:kinase-like protein [Annulohypoxylon truncatum]KAI1206243.1 kinase-like protein [Annulohypoxylon truncatum]